MDIAELTNRLDEVADAIEGLSEGYGIDATAPQIVALLEVVQSIAELVEDEAAGKRLTRLDVSEIENVVDGWLDESDKVAQRRGED